LNVGISVERMPEREMRERVLPALLATAERLRPLLV
jgi:hypothetical protein